MKTFKVCDLIEEVNRINRLSTCDPAMRMGWNTLLEHVLVETGNWEGYRYLTSGGVPFGQLPGKEEKDGKLTFPDESRRYYCVSNELHK